MQTAYAELPWNFFPWNYSTRNIFQLQKTKMMKLNTNFDWKSLKQLNFAQILLAFFLPSGFAFFGFRFLLPKMVESGYPKVLMWGLIASAMLLIFAIIGLLLIIKESRSADITIRERLLIKKIGVKQWLICLGIMIVGIVISVIVSPTVEFFKELPGLSIPDYMPFWLNPSIDPMNTDMEVLSPNYPLQGNYFILVVMSIALLLNILAEEIYFRGVVIAQDAAFRKMELDSQWNFICAVPYLSVVAVSYDTSFKFSNNTDCLLEQEYITCVCNTYCS